MAFVFSKTTPATGAVAMYEFKELLKTAGWTVLSSSDGTTYNASGDQITSGGSGANGMANNSAWFLLRSPAGVGAQQFTFQRGTGNTVWRMKRSRTAGFTGGSPSATQTPSATDEFIFVGSGTDASPVFPAFFATDGTYRWNVGADNAAPYGFWSGSFPTGGGNPSASICLDPLVETDPSDADKFILHMGVNGNTPYTSNVLNSLVGTSSSFRVSSQIISTNPGSEYAEFAAAFLSVQSGQIVIPSGLPINPITSEDEGFPLIFFRPTTFLNSGFKGISTVMRWTGTTRSTGDTLSVSATRDRIIYGAVSLPWDGTVPTV